MKTACTIAVLILSAAARQTSQPETRAFSEPESIAEISDNAISEASGIAASRRHRGWYYIHNDSGNPAAVFLIDRSGAVRAEIELAGATNVDWEDIALAQTREGADVCIADIGDNAAKRESVRLYRFPEPELPAAATQATSQPLAVRIRVEPKRYEMRYPDGPHDAEALAIDPLSGDGYIFTKQRDGRCAVFRLAAPWNGSKVTTLETAGSLRFPAAAPIQTIVTAADFSPDGRELIVRSYTCGWLFSRTARESTAKLLASSPQRVELAVEPQGEAVCFSADGRCLLTISEGSPTKLFECCRCGSDR